MDDQPISDLIVLADRNRCPTDYKCIEYSQDTNAYIDLWKDGLFSRKTNRFICFNRDANSANIIEDIKLVNERENYPPSFTNIEKTKDSSEKTLQKKLFLIKYCPRAYANTAICEIIILSSSKKAPRGFTLVGEINNYTLCYRTAPIRPLPPQKPDSPFLYPQIPMPKPYNSQQIQHKSNGNNFEHSSDFYGTVSRTYEPNLNYHPLQGIPFEINPFLIKNNVANYQDSISFIDKYANSRELLGKFDYDFNLERTCVHN